MKAETEVTIFGQTYKVKGDDPSRIKELAACLDQKMQELLAGKPGGLTVRGAVLAALNLTDELFQAREEILELKQEVEGRSQALLKILDSRG